MTDKIMVHKTISAASHPEFSVSVNALAAQGWKKTEATVFNAEGIHASLSAEVDSVLLPIIGIERVQLRAAEVYSERFAALQSTFQVGRNVSPVVLPGGTLCKLRTVGKEGEFDYEGMQLELAVVTSCDESIPKFAVIRQANKYAQWNFLAFQL